MTEPTWHADRNGRRYGPYTFDQVREMAADGLIRPDDLLTADGGGAPVRAADVPGVFPASEPVGEPAGPPLVACEKCRAGISDEAETCPSCGHPQPPLVAKQRDEELVRCPDCRALNPVRNYWYFRDKDACRGCGRAVLELYPRQRLEARVDEVYRWYAEAWTSFQWAAAGSFAVAGAVVLYHALGLIGPTWAVVGGIAGVLVGLAGSETAFSEACRAFWAGSGTPLHPDDHRRIDRHDWERAAFRERETRRQSPPADPGRPWWRGWVLAAAGFAAVWYLLPGGAVQKKVAEDREATVGAAMSSRITARKSEGVFSTDVYLTNGSDARWGTCELTLTVYFENGKRADVPRFWAEWAGREEKTINFPAGGKVERVDLKGTMVDRATGERGRVDAGFEWKPKPAPPGPGK